MVFARTVKIIPSKLLYQVTGSCQIFMKRMMALFRYFSSVDKPAKLPDPLSPLSRAVPSSSIASANAEVKGVLEIEEWTTIGAGKRGR